MWHAAVNFLQSRFFLCLPLTLSFAPFSPCLPLRLPLKRATKTRNRVPPRVNCDGKIFCAGSYLKTLTPNLTDDSDDYDDGGDDVFRQWKRYIRRINMTCNCVGPACAASVDALILQDFLTCLAGCRDQEAKPWEEKRSTWLLHDTTDTGFPLPPPPARTRLCSRKCNTRTHVYIYTHT